MVSLVHDNAMVAHLWANQSQDEARSHNGNFSFDGHKLVSYSTPIAHLIEDAQGRTVALVTSHTYSVTTSGKHMGPMWRAIGYGRTVPAFTVPFLCLSGGWNGRYNAAGLGIAEQHAGNLAYLVSEYENEKRRLIHAVQAVDRGHLDRLYTAAHDYALSFGLALPDADVDVDWQSIRDARAERFAKRNTPATIAKREREAARKAEREEEKRKAIAAANGDRIKEWQAGANVSLWGLPRDMVYLRVVDRLGDGRPYAMTLETSLGAKVPLSQAIKVFQFVKACREAGREWQRNGHTLRVGAFQVDHVLPNGDFHAGCHFIRWAETERLARLIGVFDAPASDEGLTNSHVAA